MTAETIMMDVLVHKANIPMVKGESLNQFTNLLSTEGRKHVLAKLNIAPKSGGAWLTETFQDRVVFSTYKDNEPTRYHSFTYTRDKDGSFTFGPIVEVVRVTSFEPKPGITVTKGCPGDKIRSGGKGRGMGTGEGSGPIGVPKSNTSDVQKPYPSEHAARQADPSKYDSFRRGHPKGFPEGVDAIYGIKGGKSEIQSIRFDSSKYTEAKAKAWLKDNKLSSSGFEASAKPKKTKKSNTLLEFGGWQQTTKSFWNGVIS